MARIVYALSGQGRGHTSRGMAIATELRQRGHEILFCGGGTAHDILAAKGERVVSVPALRQIMEANRVKYGRTLCYNGKIVLNMPSIVARLEERLIEFQPDLVITDFEAFSARAARRLNIPVVSFNHQQVVTELDYNLPLRYWPAALLTSAAIRLIAPRNPEHVLLTSFFFASLKHPERTTLVPPIIRPAVQTLTPSHEEHVLVYYNHPDGARHVLDALRQVDASFIVYCEAPPENAAVPNVQFKQPCLDGFLNDLATSRAVICTAGFTLISEALFLGKPLLVTPNQGIFEQTLNALFLQREGLGKAVLNRSLSARDVKDFLKHRHDYRARLQNYTACGNPKAVECIEDILMRLRPPPHPRPALPNAPKSPSAEVPFPQRLKSL